MSVPVGLEYKSTALADAPVFNPVDVDAGAHEVTAVVAVTGVRDEVGDVIVPGAFTETLRARPKPKVCLGHDWNRPIGKTVWIKELPPGDPGLPKLTFDKKPWPTEAGALLARYIPDMSKQDGLDAYNSAKFYGTEESTFSIGYRTRQAKKDNGTRYLHEVALFEYGPVLNPANRLATLQDIKSDGGDGLETKVKQVRDVAYWGEPYGTPIDGQMHPHGPKARAERRAGRVPLRSVGVMNPEEARAAAPKIAPAARAQEIAGAGLFPEPSSAARVLPGPRATGADQQHIDALAGNIRDGLAEPEADDEDRAAIDKAVRGLLTEAITPNEVRDRLAAHPEITAGADSHGDAVDRVSRDYAARYGALAAEQHRTAPAPLPADRFAGMTNTQLRAHQTASQQILSDLEASGVEPHESAHQVASANIAGAGQEMAARQAAAAAHPDVAAAHAQGLALHEGNPVQAATRADQMTPVLAELHRQQQVKAPPQGGRAERMPHQIQAMIHGLNGRNADGSERPVAEVAPTPPKIEAPLRAASATPVRQPVGAPYTVLSRKGSTATVDYHGNRYQVDARGGVLAHVTVTDPNGKETQVKGGSSVMLRRDQTADRERAVREALHTAHLSFTGAGPSEPAPAAPSAPEAGAPAETHANALVRMSDEQAKAHLATLPHSTLVGVDQAMTHRAAALGKPGVVTGKHQMVRDAIPAAPGSAVIEGPAQDDIAKAREEMLGLHELPDGHLEVEPEVAARQDRVASLLTQHESGALDLAGRSTEQLHEHHRDLSNELRLQQEIARRDAIHPPRRVPVAKTEAGTPRVRPGLAGAALDHAEALRSQNPDDINRTHQRLESALRRSRATSDTARVLAEHVAGGNTDAARLDALAGGLRAESRARRNDAARKRTAAKRLDRERITSVLGSVNAELRGRGESPEIAKELGAPRTANTPPTPTMSEGPELRTASAPPAAVHHDVGAPVEKASATASPFPQADRLPDEPFATSYTVPKSTPRLKGSQVQPGVRIGLRGSAPMWMTVAKKESAGHNLVKLTGTNGHERIITPNGYEQVHSSQVHQTEKGWELLPHVTEPDKTNAGPVKPLTDTEYQAHTQQVEQRIDAALKAGKATNVTHTVNGEGKVYTSARATLHKQIVDEIWNANGEHAPREGRSVLAGGLMGAGKSTVLGQHAGIAKGDYFTINPDEIKDAMATRGMVPAVSGLSPLEASTLIHDESSHISNMLAQRAYAHRTNVIWDVSMSNKASMQRRINEMAGHGYGKPDGVFVNVPVETSVQRALSRHRQGMEEYRQGQGMGGRYAPPHLIRQSASSTSDSANRDVFNELDKEKAFGSSVVYDNSTLGQAPRKVTGTGRWADSTSRIEPATLGNVAKTDLTPNPAWKQPREAATTLTPEQTADLRDLSHTARSTYAKQRAAGHEHVDALTLARGQSLTDASVPRSRISLRDSLEHQAVAATNKGVVPLVQGGELARAVDDARQRMRAVRNTNLAGESTHGPEWQARLAPHVRRVAALEGLASLRSTHGGTANLTDNPQRMTPARLRAHVIALEGSTNPADVRRLKTLRKAADARNIAV